MKKILFLTHVGAPGGAELKMIDLCKAIKPAAEVMHFEPGPLETLLKEQGIPSRVCFMPAAMAGFKREDGLVAMLKAIPAALSMVGRVAKACRDFDVIVCMSQKSFLLAALAKPFARRPIIWFMNDILSREHFSRTSLFINRTFSRLAATHVVLNSQASLDAWHESGGRRENVSIIYPGPDIGVADAELRESKEIQELREKFSPDSLPLVGVFGRLSPWKGQDIFIKALTRVHNARGIIVGGALFGEEEYERKIKNLAHESGMESRIHFAGHRNDVLQMMAACDVVVHCSTAPEPFGRVIVEAMLAGTPVIASDAGGAKEIIRHGETGMLTPIGNDKALADAIAYYLDNPERAKQIANKARVSAMQNFSSESANRKFQSIFQNI